MIKESVQQFAFIMHALWSFLVFSVVKCWNIIQLSVLHSEFHPNFRSFFLSRGVVCVCVYKVKSGSIGSLQCTLMFLSGCLRSLLSLWFCVALSHTYLNVPTQLCQVTKTEAWHVPVECGRLSVNMY